MTKKITLSKKTRWLKAHSVPVRKDLKPSSINRLYSFYQKNPLSTPYFEAYGMKKRAYDYIERSEEEYIIRTPKGKISAEKYIQKIDTKTKKSALEAIPAHITTDLNRYYPSVHHLRDEFILGIKPPVKASVASMRNALARINKEIIPEIMGVLKILIRERGTFYNNYDVGALCHFDTHGVSADNVTDPSFYTRVPWIYLTDPGLFERELYKAIKKGFNVVYNYKGSSVSLFRIDVYISTKWRASNMDMLRLPKKYRA